MQFYNGKDGRYREGCVRGPAVHTGTWGNSTREGNTGRDAWVLLHCEGMYRRHIHKTYIQRKTSNKNNWNKLIKTILLISIVFITVIILKVYKICSFVCRSRQELPDSGDAASAEKVTAAQPPWVSVAVPTPEASTTTHIPKTRLSRQQAAHKTGRHLVLILVINYPVSAIIMMIIIIIITIK